jgi:hypothetical protein
MHGRRQRGAGIIQPQAFADASIGDAFVSELLAALQKLPGSIVSRRVQRLRREWPSRIGWRKAVLLIRWRKSSRDQRFRSFTRAEGSESKRTLITIFDRSCRPFLQDLPCRFNA